MKTVLLCLIAAFWTDLVLAQNPPGTNSSTAATQPRAVPGPLEFKDKDRVVFLGDTWMGNDQKDAYIETLLTARLQGHKAVFRNLAWIGTNGPANAKSSESLEQDLKRLNEPLQAIQPTVAFLAYGTAESAKGEPGLERFKAELKKLMDTVTNLAAAQPVRFVLVTPLYDQSPPAESSEADARNAQLQPYANALRDLASERGAILIDLFEVMRKNHSRRGAQIWTSDGLAPTPYGYWQIANVFEMSLRLFPGPARLGIGRNNSVRRGCGGVLPEQITRVENTLRFVGRDEFVLRPVAPKVPGATNTLDGLWLQFTPLDPGKYSLKIDGELAAVRTGAQWMQAVLLKEGPLLDRSEALRQAIIKKNELCSEEKTPGFIFGFRKNKQPDTRPSPDPTVAAQEEKIFQLLELKSRNYELAPSTSADEVGTLER